MKVRFAPSPTGALHVGGARTALFNWLLARNPEHGGELLLRIEDTDRQRSTPENVEQIFDALRWLGIDWDEQQFQTDNADRHQEALQQLLDAGRAYRTTATADDVKAWKAQHGAERGYRGEDEGEGAVRLRLDDDATSVVEDAIRGPITFEQRHMDDPVIARADGSVLYNFAVAVDDLDAGITHVIRGEDHLSNTPKQMVVREALGHAGDVVWAHLPLLHGPDGKKLSKRHGAASVQELRDAGYLPEAVRNYLALLGWGYDDETTFFTTDELKERFGLDRVSRNPAVFDEQKLRWMNGRYLRELPLDELTARLEGRTGRTGLGPAVEISADKISTLDEFWPLAGFLFDGPADDPAAYEKFIAADGAAERLKAAREALADVDRWNVQELEAALRDVVTQLDAKPKAVFQPVRVAIAGKPVSPGIFESLAVLGRDESLRRIDAALDRRRTSV